MFSTQQKLIYFLSSLYGVILFLCDINPYFGILLFSGLYFFVVFYVETTNDSKKAMANKSYHHLIYPTLKKDLAVSLNQAKTFVKMYPILSHPQQKISLYRCFLINEDNKNTDTEKLKYDQQLKLLRYMFTLYDQGRLNKNIQYLIDFPLSVFMDELFFMHFIDDKDSIEFIKNMIIFNIDYKAVETFYEKIVFLGSVGLRFSLYNISHIQLESLLDDNFSSCLYCCQIPQDQIIKLMRDELMNEKIHAFHEYKTRLMVTDVENKEDLQSLPNIVDFICGNIFEKSMTIAIEDNSYNTAIA